ncbi:tyrosine-type recombinase/integrase [Zhongshania sp.]|uniref:tyrosine-type recombinase/integrase n=1 Tax=Zhongshania sp. TaxID=1971902 RepID=UPI001B6E566F|nr:tyrosine-type recombinase/integrase [Zhongshania sp.]MBQ0797552.1 tyrosine-type recombinase/integrase [Zhongshania sp.]
MVENHLADWQSRQLRDITRDMVAQRHTQIASPKSATDLGSPVGANNVMRVLRALFNFANGQYEDEEGKSLFPDNPVSRLSHTRAWNPETRRQRIIKTVDLPAWFGAIQQLRKPEEQRVDWCSSTVADYLEFILFTGLRRDDALCLLWDQVDLKAKTMEPVIHKKQKTVMGFPLAEHVAALLARRHSERVNDYVFPGREPFGKSGQSKRLDDPKKQIARVIALSGVEFSSHDLRRTFITVAESLDLSPFALKRLCSHSAGSDVTAGYVIMDIERLRSPAEKISRYLLRASSKEDSASVISITDAEKRNQG